MKEFKIRASACGNIMGVRGLGKTGETYCKDWLKGQIYNRKREINNKYLQKGNEVEDNSIDFVCEQLDLGFILKNEKFFENDFCQGTPDVIMPELIIDVKNSWDIHTFPAFETELPNKDYYWQAQVYMELVGVENYKVIYVISDTPDHLIEKEAYWYCKNNGYGELDLDVLDEFTKKMTYSDIPDNLKYKVFDIKRSQKDIDLIKERVQECKNFINELNLKIK
jgi:hypothetical protein